MIKEKMLEFMVLSEVFKTTEDYLPELDEAYEHMYIRYKKIRDEFINEFNYHTPTKTVTGIKKDEA